MNSVTLINFIFGEHRKNKNMGKKRTITILICGVIICIFIFGILLGLFDFTQSKRLGNTNYYLLKNPSVGLHYIYPKEKDMSIGVLEGRITDVYWNEEYILATQHSIKNDSIINYFIIKMFQFEKKDIPWEKIKLSTKEEYEKKKQELSLNEKKMKHIIFK